MPRSDQTEISGTEGKHPEIRQALNAVLDAEDEIAAARQRKALREATLEQRMTAAGVTRYAYVGRDGKPRAAIAPEVLRRELARARNDAHAAIASGPSRDTAIAILDDLEQRLLGRRST